MNAIDLLAIESMLHKSFRSNCVERNAQYICIDDIEKELFMNVYVLCFNQRFRLKRNTS